MREFRFYGERPRWDASLVIKVEELIDTAIGEHGKNVVDFKMLQTVLYILARHLRILEQMVEVKAHGGEKTGEDIDKGQAKHKAKDKSGKKAPSSSDVYLSSDESDESYNDDRGKTKRRGRESEDEDKIKKSRDKYEDQKGPREKHTRGEKEIQKERSEDWFTDDERKKRDDGSSGQKERGKIKDDKSLKSQKAKAGTDKDDKGVREDEGRDKEQDSTRGGKGEKIRGSDDESKAKRSDKVKKGEKARAESDEKVAKGKDKKGWGKENENKTEEKHKPRHRASVEGEIIQKGEKEVEKGHKGKAKEGDKSDKKSKRRDSREERELETILSEDREVRGRKGKGGRHYVGSIEVVTQQQFRELERAVYELQARATLPTPRMPENKKLMTDIAQGNASLTDAMEAMQLHARILATERAIERMAQLVSLLAASGELPAEVLSTFTELEADVANMVEKTQSLGVKSPREQGRKSLGLETLGAVSTLSTAETEATAAMKRGILGTSHKGSEMKEIEGEVKEGKDAKKGKKKGPIQAPEKAQRTQGIEIGQQTQGIEEGRSLFIQEHDDGVSEKEKEPFAILSQITGSASMSMGRSGHSKRTIGSAGCVTEREMNEALRALREDFMKNVGNITARANASAEAAIGIAKDVGSKLARAMTLNDRVSTLYNTVNDYTDQLHGFDSGVQTQMQSFQQQLNNIKRDLYEGLLELHNITNNAETAAVLELKEQHQLVAGELDDTLNSHRKLLTNQDFLFAEVKNIAECIEELRDQKADKDEVIDGLRDKADLSRLDGLLTLQQFAQLYEELELRMQMCYDKFRSQDAVWMTAVHEFNEVVSGKAEVSQVRALQDEAQQLFQQLNSKAVLLKRVLGDPKAAVLTRKLTKGAMCAACAHAAQMEVSDVAAVDPPRLPAFRPRPTGADDVCLREDGSPAPLPTLTPYEDETQRPHICKRWCGGSHTLLTPAVTRENAAHFTGGDTGPSRKFMGLGTDNKLYMLAEQCQPCEECNVAEKIPGETEEPPPHSGAGDQGDGPVVVTGMEARRVTIVADADIQLVRDELARKRRVLARRRSAGGGGGARARARRPLGGEMDSRGSNEDAVPRRRSDFGVTGKGHILVTVVGEGDGAPVPAPHERARGASLAQDRIREQFEAAMPNATESDLISKAIAALSEL